jgi:hypothetical protein
MAIVATAVAVVGLGTLWVARSAVVEEELRPEQVVHYNDLVAMSLRRDELLIPRPLFPAQDLTMLRELRVPGLDYVLVPNSPFPHRPLSRTARADDVRDAWWDAIRAHPIDYANVRGDLFLRLMGLRSGMVGTWYGISDQLDWRDDEFRQRFASLNDARQSYLDLFADRPLGEPSPLHLPITYVLVGVAGAVVLIVYRSAGFRVLGVATLVLQLSLQMVLLVAATEVSYRFEYFQVLLGIVLATMGGVTVWRTYRSVPGAPGFEPQPVPLGETRDTSPREELIKSS